MAKPKKSKNEQRLEQMLEAGQHLEILEQLQLPGKNSFETTALITSLSFLGRLTQATELVRLRIDALDPKHRSRARFALGIAYVRISKFKTAQKLLGDNLREEPCRKYADTWQGLGIYYYYLGNFKKALNLAKKAMGIAISERDSYIQLMAMDLLGHAMVRSGRRSVGIRYLVEAKNLTKSPGAAERFIPQKIIYEAEAGIRPATIIDELESHLQNENRQNSYTANNLVLELARQWTLRGQWGLARKLLDEQSPNIYSFENRRQEATLQLRLAEIAFRCGESGSALHFLQSARRLLSQLADRTFEMQILGLEHKVHSKLLQNSERAMQLEEKLQHLATTYSSPTTQRMLARLRPDPMPTPFPGEDPLGDLMDQLAWQPKRAETGIMELGYLGLWPESQGLNPGERSLSIEGNGHWVAVTEDSVITSDRQGLSDQSQKILRQLSHGAVSKENLISRVWGYEYDPIRHDSLVYSAMTSLRKSLTEASRWVVTHDQYWTFEGAKLRFTSQSVSPPLEQSLPNESVGQLELQSDLNWRQIEAMDKLGQIGRWQISEYRVQFGVSTMTAWRDLDGLVQMGYLKKVGRGRATAYLPLGGLS